MATSFLDATTAAQILDLKKDAFATAMMPGIGNIKSLVLSRDEDQDGTGVAQAAQTVRMVLASRSGQARYTRLLGEGAEVRIETGEFQKFSPFNVAIGDRFTLDGMAGKITALFPIDVRGVIRAAFELEQ